MEKKRQILKNRILNSSLSEKDKSGFVSFVDNVSSEVVSKLFREITSASSPNIEKNWSLLRQKAGVLKSISESALLNDEQKDLLRTAALQTGDLNEQSEFAQNPKDVAEKTKESLNEFLREATVEVNRYVDSKSAESEQRKIEKLRSAIQE